MSNVLQFDSKGFRAKAIDLKELEELARLAERAEPALYVPQPVAIVRWMVIIFCKARDFGVDLGFLRVLNDLSLLSGNV